MTLENLIAGFIAFTLLGAFSWGLGEILGRAIEKVLK